jgi:hypothetical protein
MTTRAQREAEAQHEREAEEAREAGVAYFQAYPDAMLAEAVREATSRYGVNAKHQWFAFYLVVIAARAQRNEYLKEGRA